jgi:hypothetical protein
VIYVTEARPDISIHSFCFSGTLLAWRCLSVGGSVFSAVGADSIAAAPSGASLNNRRWAGQEAWLDLAGSEVRMEAAWSVLTCGGREMQREQRRLQGLVARLLLSLGRPPLVSLTELSTGEWVLRQPERARFDVSNRHVSLDCWRAGAGAVRCELEG